MTTAWNLTREQIGAAALRKVGNLARGETANADDLKLATDALDGILKELPIFGYSWPQISATQAVLILTAGVGTVTLPTDYYGNPIVTYLDVSGNELPLPLIPLDQWLAIPRKTQAAAYPVRGYIDPVNVLHVWPVQIANVSARLSYQKILPDTSQNAVSGVDQTMVLGLTYAVAVEIADDFNATPEQVARWGAVWAQRRALGIMSATYPSPSRITVDD